MNEAILKEKCKEVKGSVKEKRGKFIEDDLAEVEGIQEKFDYLLWKKYGYSKDKSQQEYSKFINDYKHDNY